MKGKNIVIVGQQPWDIDIGSNAKNIAMEFARDNKVLYVNAPLDRITILKKRHDPKVKKRIEILRGKKQHLEKIDDNLWNLYPRMVAESANWIRIHWIFKAFNWWNNKKFAKEIKLAMREIGFDKFILFNDSLMFRGFYLKELLHPEKYIYYTRDYLIIQPYFKRHGEKLEGQLMSKSDLVVANSTYLKDYAGKFNRDSFYVGQGCEVSGFDDTKITNVPADIARIKRPVIGYVGYLTAMRLDLQLIAYMASARPDWSIALVGPEDEAFQKSQLHALPNVHFLGAKETTGLPDYVQQFDVCINPQIVNMLTIGNYPRKIDEYLAMGKPVVASKTKAMEVFAEYVYLSDTHDEFVEMIERALAENTNDKYEARKKFANSHTWENSVDEIYKAIEIAG
ncbi:glycosyltransferase [Fulvivirgaceae bacterium BMA12]|uniref:Glycosyltransferase n=1 Tax=Agaribacillus aureus TaxID=3051825 RepID=A0ABT8L1P8_9BACT|nr:glycosyltransferase [Fulvivirgaceae bacterium BMA12]